MTASLRRTVAVLVAAAGVAVVLVWAAGARPDGIVAQAPSSSTEAEQADPETPTEGETTDQTADRSEEPSGTGGWADDLITFVLVFLGLWTAWLLARFAIALAHRWFPDRRLVLDLDPLSEVEVARSALARDQDRQVAALASGDVRNGIVACWVLLEEAAAGSGVVRTPAETSAEFVVRLLHTLDVDPRPVATLARLYREARFSTHAMSSDARPQAEQALAAIHRDLDHAAAR